MKNGACNFPGVLSVVADALGEDKARVLAKAFGGRRLYVPRKIQAAHPIALALGHPAAEDLLGLFAGKTIDVPLGPESASARNAAAILDMAARGARTHEIADALSICARTVQRVKSRAAGLAEAR